jgi:hypothetical protein
MMNSESSRSHSVFTLFVETQNENEGVIFILKVIIKKNSKINFVDLAGSER